MTGLLKLTGCVAALSLLFAAPAAAGSDDKHKKAIKEMMKEASAAWLACETSEIGKYDADGRTYYYPDSAEVQADTDESRQMEVSFCENGGKHEMTYDIKDIMIMGDVAVMHGSGHYKRTEPAGTVSIDTDYTFTEILVKTSEGWRFKHTHIGAVVPEMAVTAEADEEEAE